jgi:hypothetical protein
MEIFYIIIPSVAIIFLIILLTIVGIAMRYQDKSTIYPPVANDCPDFWTVASNGKDCSIPAKGKKNTGKLYEPTDKEVNDSLKIKYSVTSDTTFPIYTPATNGNTNLAASTINFKDDLWSSQGYTSVCAKKRWATTWGISWDGITNYNSC